MIVHGQMHGGIVQGVGQALWEQVRLRAAHARSCCPARSWITRCRAPTWCRSSTPNCREVPSPTHPLGMRPAGEGGTTPALGVVINADRRRARRNSASPISRCRRRRNASGARSIHHGDSEARDRQRPPAHAGLCVFSRACSWLNRKRGRTVMARIRHIALTTKEPAKVAEFYKSAFGLKELRRSPNGAVFLTDGHINVAILNYQGRAVARHGRARPEFHRHPSFRLRGRRSRRGLPEARKRARASG